MKKKIIILIVWLITINILINIGYYLFMEDGINIIASKATFRVRYRFRKIVDRTIDYNDYAKNNVISKDNISIKLSNINYEKDSGKLKLKFDFYANNDDILENIGGVLRIYDNKKIFYHGYNGGAFWDTDNIMNLLLSKNMYGEFDETDLYNKKLYGELDDSNLNIDRFVTINNIDNDEPINEELILNLGKGYEISGKLYIDFIDFQYKSVDEFMYQKAIEPLGELKFIVNF